MHLVYKYKAVGVKMKITIRNLARITEANVELKPLTVFIGRNNTNKSYVAHVFYALFDMVKKNLGSLFSFPEKEEIVDKFDIFFKKEKISGHFLYSLKKEKEVLQKLLSLFNTIWQRTFPDYIKNPHLNTTIEIDESELLNHIFEEMDCRLILYDEKDTAEVFVSTSSFRKRNVYLGLSRLKENEKGILADFLVNIVQGLIGTYFKVSHPFFYFPAARTGFSLALDDIRSGVFEKYSGMPITRLSKPTIDFIKQYDDIKHERLLFNPGGQSKEVKEILLFFEKQLLGGKILLETKSIENYILRKFVYRPRGFSDTPLEFHCVSSMVTELAPIYSVLKVLGDIKNTFLIIEEPEAHLHPYAQLEMVKLLGMLVRNGARVLITTHSDYILNFINILIRSSQLSDEERKKLNFRRKKQDLSQCFLKPEEVRCYFFKEKKKEVELKNIEITEHGIDTETFEEVLDEIVGISEKIDNILFQRIKSNVSK